VGVLQTILCLGGNTRECRHLLYFQLTPSNRWESCNPLYGSVGALQISLMFIVVYTQPYFSFTTLHQQLIPVSCVRCLIQHRAGGSVGISYYTVGYGYPLHWGSREWSLEQERWWSIYSSSGWSIYSGSGPGGVRTPRTYSTYVLHVTEVHGREHYWPEQCTVRMYQRSTSVCGAGRVFLRCRTPYVTA
jgi:hypothetical protein